MVAAKGRLNDKINSLSPVGGQILNNTQDFSHAMVNSAWRKLQEKLADLKYSGIEQEQNFIAVPSAASSDPLTQVFFNYAGYFDGLTNWPAFALPQNFIRPYSMWERQAGSAAILTEIDIIFNGLPSVPKVQWNRQAEWRDDVLYLPGATVQTDIRMRFAQYFPDFADNSPAAATPWFGQVAPIMRCLDAFADYICREFEIARQNPDAALAFQASAEANAALIVNRDMTQPGSVQKAAELGKMGDKYTPVKGGPVGQLVKR
jgi:hypothetical protein